MFADGLVYPTPDPVVGGVPKFGVVGVPMIDVAPAVTDTNAGAVKLIATVNVRLPRAIEKSAVPAIGPDNR
jgi:hypothetical protein